MQKVLEHEFGQDQGGNGMELYFCVSERVDGKVWILSGLVLTLCLLPRLFFVFELACVYFVVGWRVLFRLTCSHLS